MDSFDTLVSDERKRQEAKWGEQNHNPTLWLAILLEEIGELASELIANEWKPELQRRADTGNELVQIAAVAKAIWESGVRNGWIST